MLLNQMALTLSAAPIVQRSRSVAHAQEQHKAIAHIVADMGAQAGEDEAFSIDVLIGCVLRWR